MHPRMGNSETRETNKMSLKAFHIVFIIISILLGFGVGSWCVIRWHNGEDASFLGIGITFIVSGIVLLIYSRSIIQKLKKYSTL